MNTLILSRLFAENHSKNKRGGPNTEEEKNHEETRNIKISNHEPKDQRKEEKMKTLRAIVVLIVVATLLMSCGNKTTPPTTDAAKQTDQAASSASTETEGGVYDNYLFTTVADYTAATGNAIQAFQEAPSLAAEVSSGTLPPLEERIPADVAVARTREGDAATYGGEMHIRGENGDEGIYSQFTEDIQQGLYMFDAGYETIHPNVAKGWSLSEDGKTLTLNLRQGMKWSNGDDFTADDFIFWWEEIKLNPDLNPEVENKYTAGGEVMSVKKVDAYTLEYSFAAPYYRAVERVLGDPIYCASKFVKQYMPKYAADAEELVASEGYETWQQAVQYHCNNNYGGDLKAPVLNPWILKDVKGDSALFVRNPYYWRVDTAGNQLPYVDSILVLIVQGEGASPVTVQAMAGEIDWETGGISLGDYPVLKEGESSDVYKVYLYPDTATSTALGFALNYTDKDPINRELFNDLRFRQALSLAIDRADINRTVFLDQTVPFAAPVSPVWTGYEDWMATYYTEFDVTKANQLLDEMGLQWDANHQWRLRPDGQPVYILGEYAINWLSYVSDILEIVKSNWEAIGVQFDPKFVEEETMMARYFANENSIGIWNSDGGSEALARSAYPIRLEPPWHWMGQGCCAMSSTPWRQWWDSKGVEGEEPPQQIKDLFELVEKWLDTPRTDPEYETLINQIIKVNVENLYYFGTVSAPPRVVIVNNRLGNLPEADGSLGSAMLRVYLPETAYIRVP